MTAAWDAVKPQLVANVRSAGFISICELGAAVAGSTCHYARAQVAPDLYATANVVTRDGMSAVTGSDLRAWGAGFDEVRSIALDRLRAMSREAHFTAIAPGIWKAPWTDAFVAARVLLPEVLQAVCVDPYVAVVDARTVYVADPAVSGSYDRLASLLIPTFDGLDEDSDLISIRIYRPSGSQLLDATPPPDATLAGDLMLRVDQLQALQYAEERSIWHETEGFDAPTVYVQLGKFRDKTTNRTVTWATWARSIAHVPQLLPEVDLVSFALDEGEIYMVPFETVATLSGALTRSVSPLARWRTGVYPPRNWIRAHSVEPPAFPWRPDGPRTQTSVKR